MVHGSDQLQAKSAELAELQVRLKVSVSVRLYNPEIGLLINWNCVQSAIPAEGNDTLWRR